MNFTRNRGYLFGILAAVMVLVIGLAVLFIKYPDVITLERIGKGFLYIIVFAFIVFLVRNIMQTNASSTKYNVIKSSNITFDQIAGMQEVKKEVQVYIDIMKNREEYLKSGIRMPKGIIFEGSPGNGKTLLAKAIASEMHVSFIQANACDIGGIIVGKGTQDLKKLFRQARKIAPCIVFLDEIDAIGGKRMDNGNATNTDSNRIVTSLLTELDGFEGNEGIFVIAATNRVDSLDDALVRPGRFDRKITIKNPDYTTRLELIKMYTKDKKLSPDLNLEDFAWKLAGMCCADIENCVNAAAIQSVSRGAFLIEPQDFEQTIVQQKIKGYLLPDEEEIYQRELTAYHEAGHAMVTHLLTEDVIDLVSIVPTTSHVKGFTMSYSKHDRSLLALKEIRNRICILLAGRAAEYLYLGGQEENVTTGCADDLQRAVQMMKNYLKTCTDGIHYNVENDNQLPPAFHDSLQTLSLELWEETVSLCRENWDKLSKMADVLSEQKWITKGEVEQIWGIA